MNRIFLISTVFITLTSLLSCGGGKGEEAEKTTPYIKMEKKIIYFQGAEGGPSLTYGEELKFKVLDANGGVYIQVKNNNAELVERTELIPATTNGDASLTVFAAQPYTTKIAKGTHQGSIELSLCEDNLCSKPVPYSSVTISIIFEVL